MTKIGQLIYTLNVKVILKYKEMRRKIMLERISEIVAEQLNADKESISEETRFKEDLEADSLDLFEIVMSIEDEYNVEIPSEDLENIVTVGNVIEYLKSKGVE